MRNQLFEYGYHILGFRLDRHQTNVFQSIYFHTLVLQNVNQFLGTFMEQLVTLVGKAGYESDVLEPFQDCREVAVV